jgi:hypothetical protein
MNKNEREKLLKTLKVRFDNNAQRHKGVAWADVQKKLEANSNALESLHQMEETGGEPDVIGKSKAGRFIFCDCSAESPKGRRSLCYDAEALASRKEHKPKDSAAAVASAIGIELLNEERYLDLQKLGEFDMKTSSWIETPSDVRERGGALYGDRRYGRVFIYHNGAESYYGARGFRGFLEV